MAIIGAILGDIAGSRWEMGRPDDLDWKHIELFTDGCFFTDDTVLTVTTRYALKLKMNFADAYKQFALWYPNVSYGAAFSNWVHSDTMRPYGSFGNGSAMRISPIVEYANDEAELKKIVCESVSCTHNHQEGLKGAEVTAVCAWMAGHGAAKNDILKYALFMYPADKYRFSPAMSLTTLRECYSWDVTCQGSVPVAIRCFMESEDYESFIRNVLSLKCDTDTLCAIGGCIAEEYYGRTGFEDSTLLSKYLDARLLGILEPQFGWQLKYI